jgi:tungstate transport system ATP-binding protein
MAGTAYLLDGISFAHPDDRLGRFALELDKLRVEEGKTLALVGPNGAGKTTLLMLLALLVRPDEGYVSFFGRDPWSGPDAEAAALRRDAVLVTHHPYLFRGTVGDNLAFGLRVRGIAEPERAGRIRDALALVELPGWERRSGSGLSAGQVQRIALARALALRPKVLLLDEPTANLEAGLSLRIEAVIGEAAREEGTAVVFSTHNFSQASRLADEILYLSEGRRVPFGHENCFSGPVRTDGRTSWIEPRPGTRLVFSGTRTGHVTCIIDPGRIRIGPVRPEGAADRGDPAGDNVFTGTVTRLEMTEGGRVLVRIAGELTFRAVLSLGDLERKGIALSHPVLVRFAPEAVELVEPPPSEAKP